MRRAEWFLLAALLLTLAACRTTPPTPSPPAPSIPPPTPTPTPPPPPPTENVPNAIPRPEPRSRQGNPPFYTVYGQRYFVLPSPAGYLERGVASWYGPDFHGGNTANGEKYDMYKMTAAHKTLPLPCYVRVTNLRNGKSITVRVNDRGPFVANRLIDLSYTAAAKLDMIREGTSLVEVRVVDAPGTGGAAPSPAAPATIAPKPDQLYVQAGAFSDEVNAERLLQKLRAAGIGVAFVRRDEVNGQTVYRVRVGPVPTVAEFDRVVQELRGVGVTEARLATD